MIYVPHVGKYLCVYFLLFCNCDTTLFVSKVLLNPKRTPVYIHPFNGPFSGTTQASHYQKGKTSLDFTEARNSEWQWHQLDHMQVCTLPQTDNHASTQPLSFLQARCLSCCQTNSVKALKAKSSFTNNSVKILSSVHNSFTAGTLSVSIKKFPNHLKYVTALPCKM